MKSAAKTDTKTSKDVIAARIESAISARSEEITVLLGALAILNGKSSAPWPGPSIKLPPAPAKGATATAQDKSEPKPKASARAGKARGVMSEEGRARVAEAQRIRWAKVKREQRAAGRKLTAKATAKKAKPVMKAKGATKPAPKPTPKPTPKPKPPAKPPVKTAARAVRMSDSVPTPPSSSATAA